MELRQWLIWPINFNEISQVGKAVRNWPSDEILLAFSESNAEPAVVQPTELQRTHMYRCVTALERGMGWREEEVATGPLPS